MKSLCLPGHELAREFQSLTRRWFEKNNKPLEAPVSEEQAYAIISAMVYTSLDRRMRWLRVKNNYLHPAITLGFPQLFNTEGADTKTEEGRNRFKAPYEAFDRDVIDVLEVKLEQMLDYLVPSMTWRIYHIKRLGRDFLIERGQDYRIADWTRRLKNGEIKLED